MRKQNSCGHKKSAIKSVGRSFLRWESLAAESAELGHIKCNTCKLLAIIENMSEPTGSGLMKYSTKRAEVAAFEGFEEPAIAIAA
jgi:hypothetical protein